MAKTIKAVEKTASAKKVRIELWSYDEYNQGSIVATGSDIDDIIKKGQRLMTEANVDNALAAGEKDKAWESYLPVFFKGKVIDTERLYAGNKRNGQHYQYTLKDDKWVQEVVPADAKFKFYLGEITNGKTKTPWYLADHRGNEITNLSNQLLERKTVLFVKIV